MTEEQKKIALETLAKSEAREEKRRENRDVRWTSRKEGEEKSHNAVKGTLASIGVGAREGVKNAAVNAKAFVKTDLGTGRAQGLKTAEKAVTEGVDYDTFMDEMRQKYGKIQTFWPMKMYASVLQKKKLGLGDKESLAQAQSEQQAKQQAIDAERLVRSIKSRQALQAVDDRYELGKIGEFAQDAGAALGNMAPSLAVGAINPAAGLAAFGVQAAAQGYGQALDDGASHEQAARYGVGTGLLETGTERMFGGVGKFFGRGALDKMIKMAPNDSVKNVLLNTAKGAVGEGTEEVVAGYLDPYLRRATYDPEAKNASFSDLSYQAAIGAVLGGMLGGGSNVLGYRAGKRAAEREQMSAQEAQTERVTVATSQENEGLKRKIGVDGEGQKVVVRREPTESDMPKIKAEYEKSVNGSLLQFVRDVKNKVIGMTSYKLSDVQPREAEDVRELTGIDVSGYEHVLRSNTVEHIEKRHGANGNADHSMANEDDMARIGYVLNNYDSVQLSKEKSNSYKNADNTPAQTIIYRKRVNGDYYVVEAVPDSKAKKLQIVTAYKTKKAVQFVADSLSSQPDVRNEQTTTASNSTVAENGQSVKSSGEHIDNRDYKSVGSRKMNAFSYDNPEVRPYYVTEAKRMQQELSEAQKPNRYFGQGESGLKDTDAFVGGHGRIASADIVTARDEIGLSYKEIGKALDDIIADSGKENNANAKKLEVLFDQNLSMGMETGGYRIPPNAEYIRTKEGIAGAKDYGYKAEQSRYENGEFDPINDDPYAFEATVYAIAQRRGHELTETEAEEVEALQEVIDADRSAFTEEEIRQLIDEQVSKWKMPQKEAQTPYEQAFDEMLRGEDSTKAVPNAESEEEKRVKDFIQSAAVRARMQVKYVDRPLVQKAYYKDGVIYINKNRPMDEGVKVTVAHELYHAMEGTKEHEAIVKLAFEGKDAEAMIAEKIEKYRQSGVELDETGARAEIGAEFIEKALTDEATINQVLLENRTLAAKILERIKEIIAVYKAKKSMKAEEAREYAALLKARRLYEDGLEKLHNDEYAPAGVERNARYSITQDQDGYLVNIDTDQDIFDGVPKKDYAKIAKMYIQDYLVGRKYDKNGETVGVNERTAGKYPYALDSKQHFAVKMRLTPEIENMITISETLDTNIPDSGKHPWVNSWDYYKARFAIGDKVFEGVLNIANTNTGEGKILYDINKIKEVDHRGYSNVSDADTHLSTSFVNSNIPNSAENVNSKSVENEKNFSDERFAIDEQGKAEKVGYRFFDNTFQNTPVFDKAVKEIERSYEHERTRTSEKENIAEARRRLKENGWHKEINTVLNKSNVDGADTDVAMAIISQLNNYETDSAEFGRIMKFAEDYAEKTVESGQFIQSLAKYTRTPEGKTQKAMRDIKREEKRLQEDNPKEWNDVEKKSAKAKAAVKSAQDEAASEAVDEAVQNIGEEAAERIVNTKRKKKESTAAERLAGKIKGQVNKAFAKDKDTVDNARLQRDIINELYRLAKESPLPDKAINVQKKDYVKIMRDILHNQEKYADIWDEAKEIVAKKYKGDAEKMAALEDYFDNYTVPIYSAESMRIAVKGAMDDLKLDVRDILMANKADKTKAQEDIKTLLGEKLGFSELDAETVDVVSNDIVNTFERTLQKKAQKKLQDFLNEEVKDVKKRDSIEKQMMRMVRGGYFSEDEVARIVRKAFDVPSLTTEEVQEILSHYKMADNYAEGSYERRKWEAKAQKIIADKVPKTLAEKNKTARRVAMLLNPGTWWRNIDGNIIFGAAEMVKNVPAGLADMAVSKVTGKRTTSVNIAADVGAYAKGAKRGAQEWWQDIQSGVDTSHNAVREEYQINGGKVFSEKHLYGRLYNKADTVVAKALQLGDRPFYEGAYEQRISEMKRLGYDVESENVQAEAKIYALERVYQNDSKISKTLTEVRNKLGLFGHFLIPFTQTPGNLLDKCIDYSGAGGLARALVQIGQAKKTGMFDQKLFVDRIGRALTGLGTMVFGAFLYANGYLTGTDDDDYKVSGAERLAGKKEYALHIGDNYYTIDWAQPVSAVLIAGAEAHKAGIEADDWQQMAIASGEGIINTLFAMSCLEGLESMMSSYGSAEPADKIAEVMISGVGQYFPTTIRRLNNVIDPYQRQTYDPNPLIKQGKYILSGVPGASYLLAPKYTLEGEVQMKSQGRGVGSRVYENFLVPYNKSKEYHSEVNDELLRIYENTGAKSQFLHYAQKKLDYGDGGKYVLEPEDYNKMQKEIGQNVAKADKEFMRSSVYKSMSDDDKAEALGVIATYYDNKFKEDYAKKNKIDFANTNYEGLKEKLADAGGWANYFAIKEAFPDSNYDVAKKRKEKCDKYGIDYTAYAESNAKIAELRAANSERYTKASEKTEANKRAIAQYLASRNDLTNPQRQVIWQEYYSGKTSETYISVARRATGGMQ